MRVSRAWDKFWFQPQETVTIGVVRFLIGLLLLCWGVLMAPAVSTWFTNQGAVRAATAESFDGPGHFSLLFLNSSTTVVWIVFAVLMLSSLFMMLGFCTRLSCICVYICLLSFEHRDLVVLNSGDTMLKMVVFFLCFTPAGASFSLDARRRLRRGADAGKAIVSGWRRVIDDLIFACPGPMAAPWGQRLIQIQVSLVYISTFLWKSGPTWKTGYAMYIVSNLSEMSRFPLPALFHSNFFTNLQTWFGLIAEFSMGVLVWFPATRLLSLLLGCILHLGIEYTMNIPLFASIMVVSYLTFLSLPELRDRFLLTRGSPAAEKPPEHDESEAADRSIQNGAGSGADTSPHRRTGRSSRPSVGPRPARR